MALRGTVWPAEESSGQSFEFDDVDFISFVSNQTFGKPAIIAPGTDDFSPAGGEEVTVLYVNPGNVAALLATKS